VEITAIVVCLGQVAAAAVERHTTLVEKFDGSVTLLTLQPGAPALADAGETYSASR
jgi:hypothetical protein